MSYNWLFHRVAKYVFQDTANWSHRLDALFEHLKEEAQQQGNHRLVIRYCTHSATNTIRDFKWKRYSQVREYELITYQSPDDRFETLLFDSLSNRHHLESYSTREAADLGHSQHLFRLASQ